MTITPQQIESLKASLSISALFERDGHKLFRVAEYHKCLCPFHRERSASCVVYDDHFHCFGCHSSGDVIAYVMKRDNVGFVRAFEILSGGRSVAVVTRVPLPRKPRDDDKMPTEFFQALMKQWRADTFAEDTSMLADSLGVSPEPLTRLGVAWAEEHAAFAIPMFNGFGVMVGIRLRDNNGRKWAVKGSRQGLFIPTGTPRNDLAVTEGPTDCAAVLSMGMYCVGKSAAMQSPDELLKFIARTGVRRVIVIADNDTTGIKGAAKLIDVCPVMTCELILPTKDVREFAKVGGSRELFDVMLMNQKWRLKNENKSGDTNDHARNR